MGSLNNSVVVSITSIFPAINMLRGVVFVIMALSVSAYPDGAPHCMYNPRGPHSSPTKSDSFTFSVSEVNNTVEVKLSTNESFKGILIMSNFDSSSNSPDLVFGEWSGSSSNTEFKALSDKCGMTHTNNNDKTGSYTFYFNPKGEGWKLNGFRALIVVSTKDVHAFEILPLLPAESR